ncbi:hypothetical protein TNCV_2419271 [Trichonephila clavipes]|nr:hypothetical protein TNCV_2419271 [Trichonephila clavipes]
MVDMNVAITLTDSHGKMRLRQQICVSETTVNHEEQTQRRTAWKAARSKSLGTTDLEQSLDYEDDFSDLLSPYYISRRKCF